MKHKVIRLSRRELKRAKHKAYEDLICELKADRAKIKSLEQANQLLHIAVNAAQERANKAEAELRRYGRPKWVCDECRYLETIDDVCMNPECIRYMRNCVGLTSCDKFCEKGE